MCVWFWTQQVRHGSLTRQSSHRSSYKVHRRHRSVSSSIPPSLFPVSSVLHQIHIVVDIYVSHFFVTLTTDLCPDLWTLVAISGHLEKGLALFCTSCALSLSLSIWLTNFFLGIPLFLGNISVLQTEEENSDPTVQELCCMQKKSQA